MYYYYISSIKLVHDYIRKDYRFVRLETVKRNERYGRLELDSIPPSRVRTYQKDVHVIRAESAYLSPHGHRNCRYLQYSIAMCFA